MGDDIGYQPGDNWMRWACANDPESPERRAYELDDERYAFHRVVIPEDIGLYFGPRKMLADDL